MENINNQSHIMYYFLGLKGLSSRIIVKDISIDHFVPWSYVAHDEMWNLNPTTKSINSFKSNKLPDWNTYFKRLAMLEY